MNYNIEVSVCDGSSTTEKRGITGRVSSKCIKCATI